MPLTKAKELRELSAEDITTEIAKAKRDLFDLRFKKATRQMETGFHEFKQLRRRLAQLMTIQRERGIEEEQVEAAKKLEARVKEAAENPLKTPEEKRQAKAAKRKAKAEAAALAAPAETATPAEETAVEETAVEANPMEENPVANAADAIGATAAAAVETVTDAAAAVAEAVTGSSEE